MRITVDDVEGYEDALNRLVKNIFQNATIEIHTGTGRDSWSVDAYILRPDKEEMVLVENELFEESGDVEIYITVARLSDLWLTNVLYQSPELVFPFNEAITELRPWLESVLEEDYKNWFKEQVEWFDEIFASMIIELAIEQPSRLYERNISRAVVGCLALSPRLR